MPEKSRLEAVFAAFGLFEPLPGDLQNFKQMAAWALELSPSSPI